MQMSCTVYFKDTWNINLRLFPHVNTWRGTPKNV